MKELFVQEVTSALTAHAFRGATDFGFEQIIGKYVGVAEEMVQRVLTMWTYFEKVGRGLNSAIDAFNKTVGSFEHRVRPSARQLEEHVQNVKDLKEIEPVTKTGRSLAPGPTVVEASDRNSA